MLEINGISEQDNLRKFAVAMCIRVRVPSKKKMTEMSLINLFKHLVNNSNIIFILVFIF